MREIYRSPRGTWRVSQDRGQLVGRSRPEDPELAHHIVSLARRTSEATHPALATLATSTIRTNGSAETRHAVSAGRSLRTMPRADWNVPLLASACLGALDAVRQVGVEPGIVELEMIWWGAEGPIVHQLGVAGSLRRVDEGMRGAALLPVPIRTTPEALLGARSSAATDVFVVAYLVWELLAGREPYPRDHAFAYLTALRDGRVDDHPAIPADWSMALRAALANDPAARPSARELVSALS